MTQSCKVCNHPKRLLIDRELVAGANVSRLARKYDVPYHSMFGHNRDHLSRQLVQAYERKRQAEDFNLLERIEQILSRCEKIFRRNYAKNSVSGDNLALKSISEQRQTFELLAKIAAHLHEVRSMELQMAQSTTDNSIAEREQEFAVKVCNNLNDAEQDMLMDLLSKVEGETDDVIIPDTQPTMTRTRLPDTNLSNHFEE